jgi:hypothetical protein
MIYKKRKKFRCSPKSSSRRPGEHNPYTGPSSTAKFGNQILQQVHKYVRFSEYLLHPGIPEIPFSPDRREI